MPEIKNVFQQGKMNKDLDERLVPNGQYRDAMNVQISSSEESEVGTVQNILGNKRVESIIGEGFKCVGAVADEKNNVLYWFVTNAVVDAIIEYHDDGTVTPILVDTNKDVLKFDYNDIITGINIIDNLLFWTDNETEPKKINIDTLKLNNVSMNGNPPNHNNLSVHSVLYINDNYIEPIIESHITVIRKKPNQAPTVTFSESSYQPIHFLGDDESGSPSTLNLNGVEVDDPLVINYFLPTPLTGANPPFLSPDILLLVVSDDSDDLPSNYTLKVQIDSQAPIYDSGGFMTLIGGEYTCTVLEITGSWDNVDYEFAVTKYIDKKNIFKKEFVRFATRYKYDDNEFSAFSPFTDPIFMAGRFGFHPTEDPYNLGMENTSISIMLQNLIPPDIPKDVIQVDILFKKERSTTVYSIDSIKSNDPSPSDYWHHSTNISKLYYKSDNFGPNAPLTAGNISASTFGRSGEYEITTENIYAALPENQMLRPWDNVPRQALAQEITANRIVYGNYLQNYNLKDYLGDVVKPQIVVDKQERMVGENYHNNISPTFDDKRGLKSIKSLRTYYLGVVYGDKYGRETPVFTSKDASINIPFDIDESPLGFSGAANKSLRLTAKLLGRQPRWAHYFKYFIKQTTGEYYNLTMDRVYKSAGDVNLWISFPSSDRNKIQEGDYFAIKKQVDIEEIVPVENNIKIIDIKNEAPESIKYDFVSLGSGGGGEEDLADLFPDPGAAPVAGGKRLLIDKDSWVIGENGLNLEDLSRSERLAVQFSITVNNNAVRSRKYFVSGYSLEDNGTTQRYNLLLRTTIEEDDSWVESDPGVLNSNEALTIHIYRLQEKHPNEFEGRFFVKIISSPVTQTYLIPSVQDTYAIQIIGTAPMFRLADQAGTFNSTTGNYNVAYNTSNTGALFSTGGNLTDTRQNFLDVSGFDGTNTVNQGWFLDSLGFMAAQENGSVLAERSGKMTKGITGHYSTWNEDHYVNGIEAFVCDDAEITVSGENIIGGQYSTSSGVPMGPRHWLEKVHELKMHPEPDTNMWGNNLAYGPGVGTDNYSNTYLPVDGGGHWMHLSFMAPGVDLHNGDHRAFDDMRSYYATPNSGNPHKMFERFWMSDSPVFQNIASTTIFCDGYGDWRDNKFNYPSFSQSTQISPEAQGQWDPGYNNANGASVAARLEPGRRFIIAGDDTNEVYTIKRVNIKRLYNHTTWNYTPRINSSGVGSGSSGVAEDYGNYEFRAPSVSWALDNWFISFAAAGANDWEHSNHDEELAYLKNIITDFGRADNRRVCYILQLDKDPRNSTIDGAPFPTCTAEVSQVIRFIDDYVEPGGNTIPISPAIFETEAKENLDLNIYYEASDALPIGLTGQKGQLLAPLGCKVTCSLSGSMMDYTDANLTYPDQFALRVSAWDGNKVTLNGPGLNVIGGANVSAQTAVYSGYHLYFWRENGGYAKGRIGSISTISPNGSWITEVELLPRTWESDVGLSWYNCFSFGNGVESNRIRDDYNESYILNGVKASTVLEEPYEEERRKYGLIYSGLYNSTSGINNLNQFIQAEKITKDLMPSYGSIQKLYARDKDLITLCEDKVIQVYVDKDILYNADGNTQLLATNKVLGTAEPFRGNFGISTNPESFAAESFRAYFTDKQRGAVLRLSMDGLTPISDIGMHDFFRDSLKLGGKLYGNYDQHKGDYNLSIFYANGDNLITNPDFETGGTYLIQQSSNYLLNSEFTNTYQGQSENFLQDSFHNDWGTMAAPYGGYGFSGGGIGMWNPSNPITIAYSSQNSPTNLTVSNIDATINSTANHYNDNNSDGTGSIQISDPIAGDSIMGSFYTNAIVVGGNVQVSWDFHGMDSTGTSTNTWTTDHKIKVDLLDEHGNGCIIPQNEIQFHQGNGSMRCEFNKTISANVDPGNPYLNYGGTATGWRIRMEVEGVNWGTSSFHIDNINVSSPELLTTEWNAFGPNLNGTLLSYYYPAQSVDVTPGTYRIEVDIHEVITGGHIEAGFISLGLNAWVAIKDNNDDPITAPGVYYKDILIASAGTYTFRFGNTDITDGLFRVDAISLKKVTPSGGTITNWNLNDSSSGNPYPSQIYFYLGYYGGGKIGFNDAVGYTFLSQGLVGQNFINGDKYRVTFKISDYSGSGSLACRVYNEQGLGFWQGGFSANGNYEVFGTIGDNVTYNPAEEEEFAFYVESGSTFTGNIDNIILEKVGGGETITFNEESKGWVSFKSFIPEYGISVVNQYYTMDKGKLYHHHHPDISRNTFYNTFEESSVTPILNLQPDVVKNFNTLNYEGSQSKIDNFATVTHGGVNYTDDQYYNLYDKDGWYVYDIHTDKQLGQVNEFIEKEGKWFNHIKSEFGIIDPRAFNFQGIGIIESYTIKGPSRTIVGCMDPEAVNFDELATEACVGCCVTAIPGCMDPLAFNYNEEANIFCTEPVISLGISYPCCVPFILGCRDELNSNYNPLANTDDPAACDTHGCTDESAFNYNPSATIDDGSCEAKIFGCTDSSNGNYNPSANTDDGSCYVFGCTNPNALNYNAAATNDDDSCIYSGAPGCTDPAASNYNPSATVDDGSCILETEIRGCFIQGRINYNCATALYTVNGVYTPPTSPCTDGVNVDDGSCLDFGVGGNMGLWAADPCQQLYNVTMIGGTEGCVDYHNLVLGIGSVSVGGSNISTLQELAQHWLPFLIIQFPAITEPMLLEALFECCDSDGGDTGNWNQLP